MQHITKIATNAHTVTGVAFLNLPPIVNALGVSRITSRVVSLFSLSFLLQSTQPMFIFFIFFQEQGCRNDLLSKCDGPVP
jgi:hypothetical protein